MSQNDSVKVGVAMGSQSDWPVMEAAADLLAEFGVAFEARVLSAHRTPEAMTAYAEEAASRGLKVIIAGAGGAAHLPGMIAASTSLPVIGVPRANTQPQGPRLSTFYCPDARRRSCSYRGYWRRKECGPACRADFSNVRRKPL